MVSTLPKIPEEITKDLLDFDSASKSLHMPASVKNIERLKDLQIENLWVFGPKEADLKKILSSVRLKFLSMYQILAKDLSMLETQTEASAIILNWNTKSTALWNISKNKNLKTLSIEDFPKLEEIDQLSAAKQIDNLILGGGINNKLKIKTLQPLASLDLKYLSLTNIKVADGSLKALGELKNLKELEISNQFETKEYAWLATRLPNTKCEKFNAVTYCNIRDQNQNLVCDVMPTGKGKSFLSSTKDKEKIARYIDEFERLKKELAD